jgi:hypothetical protein
VAGGEREHLVEIPGLHDAVAAALLLRLRRNALGVLRVQSPRERAFTERLSKSVVRGAESWQFFVFAALVALALALLDEVPSRPWRRRPNAGPLIDPRSDPLGAGTE